MTPYQRRHNIIIWSPAVKALRYSLIANGTPPDVAMDEAVSKLSRKSKKSRKQPAARARNGIAPGMSRPRRWRLKE